MIYTALLALPDNDMAADAAARIPGASVTTHGDIGIWVSWSTTADTDDDGCAALQEIRLRAEMHPEYARGGMTPSGANPTLFQSTPFLILRGDAVLIHSEEVLCV